jgi:hypothetical protein
LTDELKPEDIQRLRAVLRPPLRERYDFGTTMNRWAREVRASDDDSEPVLPDDGTNWDELIAEISEPNPHAPKTKRQRKKPSPQPRTDKQLYATLWLGVIYHEYTRKQPKWFTKKDGTPSPFCLFAAEALRLIGLSPSVNAVAFREASERWDRSREFSKDAMKRLLWGGLVPAKDRRKKLPT